ncbi:hypothetical protein [Aliagarivorans taiwanensis]|uniref:hypothetical protein n=1 Tax=Aliagarivorans taiwanensis TaxID=561966 RepID=UPI000478F585|nr:hypothetical protein [Aliagarivorans taiwanensis]
MAGFTKSSKYTLHEQGIKFECDTAIELGRLMVEAGVKIQNPYDLSTTDFDDFNYGVNLARSSAVETTITHYPNQRVVYVKQSEGLDDKELNLTGKYALTGAEREGFIEKLRDLINEYRTWD